MNSFMQIFIKRIFLLNCEACRQKKHNRKPSITWDRMGRIFTEKQDVGETDFQLVEDSMQGSQTALEKLVLRHQAWIYNIAFKMVMDHDDASDITQEILIKTISALPSYNPDKAAFRTWIYRITVNHVLTMKKKKFEYRINDIETYVSLIEKLPEDRACCHPEKHLLEEEIKIGCMTGMIMCLSRKERMVFILGGIFGIPDTEGSEIMEISKVNFRKILSRARKKISPHVNDFCGQIDSKNPCCCASKVTAFLSLGMADPKKLRFHHPSRPAVKDVVTKKYKQFRALYYEPFLDLYQQQPFYDPPDTTRWLRDILQHRTFREIFNL